MMQLRTNDRGFIHDYLYLRQKELLDTFLEHGAISRAQYDKSLGDLTEKMGIEPSGEPKV